MLFFFISDAEAQQENENGEAFRLALDDLKMHAERTRSGTRERLGLGPEPTNLELIVFCLMAIFTIGSANAGRLRR